MLRISKQLGWVPSSATRESAYEHLNKTIPPDLKLDLHCLLVCHGKHCHACAANGKPQFPPKDGTKLDCPLNKSTMTNNMHAVVAAATKAAAAAAEVVTKEEKVDGRSSDAKRGKIRVKEEDTSSIAVDADLDLPKKKKSKRFVVKKEE